jgi:hypothetical protein
VPCDFDTRKAISASVGVAGLQMTASLGTVLVKGQSGTTEPPKAPEKGTQDTTDKLGT